LTSRESSAVDGAAGASFFSVVRQKLKWSGRTIQRACRLSAIIGKIAYRRIVGAYVIYESLSWIN
jgi:hypothetical protein